MLNHARCAIVCLALSLGSFWSTWSLGEEMKADVGAEDVMVAYAQDAEDFFRERLEIELDYSEESVEGIEQVLGHLHQEMLKGPGVKDPATAERIDTFAKMFGGYVGEVMRRNWGGRWKLQSEAFPGETVITLELPTGTDCWPQFKAGKRIVNGPEDNIWDYFRITKERIANARKQ